MSEKDDQRPGGFMHSMLHPIEHRERVLAEQAHKKMLANVQKIKGKPWWEADVKTYVVEYKDLAQLNAEVAIVEPLGWEMAQTATQDGHVHLGRAFFTGGLTLLAKGGRSKGKTTVTWKRT